MVTQNNYLAPLFNGDFVRLVSLGDEVVYMNLKFCRVRIRELLHNKEYELLMAIDVLTGNMQNLSMEQQTILMTGFVKRMLAKGIRPNTQEFSTAMQQDQYLNSLRAVYGYAVTCHKAQGGEWHDVYLFLHKSMYGSADRPRTELVRWWYTAITRAKHRLHLLDEWWIS